MLLQNWWYTTLLGTADAIQPPLAADIKADVVVVNWDSGPFSGNAPYRVEAPLSFFSTGTSAAVAPQARAPVFSLPDSELELSQILRRFGPQGAHHLWQVPQSGIALITKTVSDHGIVCDLQKQDSLFLANDRSGTDDVREEADARRQLGYPLTEYTAPEVAKVLGSSQYHAGVRYGGTYGIDALRYSQGVKRVLLDRGVRIFESSEAHAIDGHTVRTHGGSVTADRIVVCADKLPRRFTQYAANVFHAETYLTISARLTDRDVSELFPGDPLQCWDSDLVYSYWRLTGDQRILLGGGSALTTYARHAVTSPRVAERVVGSFHKKFPALRRIEFLQYWPGLIDMTRDLFPTVIRDARAPWVQFVLGCVGLPWAAFCGDFAARHALNREAQNDHIYTIYTMSTFVPIGLSYCRCGPSACSANRSCSLSTTFGQNIISAENTELQLKTIIRVLQFLAT